MNTLEICEQVNSQWKAFSLDIVDKLELMKDQNVCMV